MEQILESRPFHYEHFRSAQLNVDLRIANCCNLAQEVMNKTTVLNGLVYIFIILKTPLSYQTYQTKILTQSLVLSEYTCIISPSSFKTTTFP